MPEHSPRRKELARSSWLPITSRPRSATAPALLLAAALALAPRAHAQSETDTSGTLPPVQVYTQKQKQKQKPRQSTAGRQRATPAPAESTVEGEAAAPFRLPPARGLSTPLSTTELSAEDIASKRAATSDTASLLSDVPGVSVYAAGGLSSLPVIQGLADDRLRIKVDGMDTIASCPNHMNPALSYIDPNQVASAKVWTGVTPVSVGGDSIGGAIVVSSAEPLFAQPGERVLTTGSAGSFYRSNGNALGANVSGTVATEHYSASYSGAYATSENYKAGGNFKKFPLSSTITRVLPGDEVGSSAYEAQNHLVSLAYRNDGHLLEFKAGAQSIPYQLYPNQRMDMLGNTAYSFNLHYLGSYSWGDLEARAYHQTVDHYMNFGDDRLHWYGTLKPPMNTWGGVYPVLGMPMFTATDTTGASAKADIKVGPRDVVRVGLDAQAYRLDDWWPPAPDCGVGNCIGGMAPLTFWNINDGERDRVGVFTEWERKWTPSWASMLGARFERVDTDTGPVVGYNTSTTPAPPMAPPMLKTMYETSSVGTRADFNAMDRSRGDNNVDLAGLIRHTPNANVALELGLGQKTRSPNLYERYSWSRNGMALEMNNFVGDGNGYLGNPDLKPEVAHTVSFTGAFRDNGGQSEIRLTPYFTHVEDYIDAVQWDMRTNTPSLTPARNRFVTLKYMNQEARLFGFDLSGRMPLAETSFGDYGLKGVLSYTNGKNLETGDGLYNIMPLNGKLALTQKFDGWDNAIELVMVSEKYDVSSVRNELKLPGYALLNLRGNYRWENMRFSFGVENVLDKLYYLPQGGAYLGEGASMSFNKEAGNVALNPTGTGASGTQSMWGTGVPGPGRTFYIGASIAF